MSKFDKFKIDLSKADMSFPPLDELGLAYRGHPAWVSGPTGSAKTGVCRGIALAEIRADHTVGWVDLEMTPGPTAAYFNAMGAKAAEFGEPRLHYWSYPELVSLEEARDFADHIMDTGVETLFLDKWPDFMRLLGGDNDGNNDTNALAAAFLERMLDRVAVYVIDATGWGAPGQNARVRGASEKGFKTAISWVVKVVDEPSKTHVGVTEWRCDKDRFGEIGGGTAIQFSYGGDGQGGITFQKLGVRQASQPGEAGAQSEEESAFDEVLLRAAQKIAPDAGSPHWKQVFFDWVYEHGPRGTHDKTRLIAAINRLIGRKTTRDRLVAVPKGMKAGNETFQYHFAEAEEEATDE